MQRIISPAIWKIFNRLKRMRVYNINPVILDLRIVFDLRQKATKNFPRNQFPITITPYHNQVGKRTIINYTEENTAAIVKFSPPYTEIQENQNFFTIPRIPSVELNWRSLSLSVTDISKRRE